MSAASRITPLEFLTLIHETAPATNGVDLTIEELSHGRAVVRLKSDPSHVRAGGTVSGPTLMMLADLALYAAVLSVAGLEALAVTTDLSFHFLSRPPLRDLVAEARVLKQGRTLVVGDVLVRSEGGAAAVVHAVGTYALPPR